MRREAAVAGFGFWFLVAAFLALLGGRARAQNPAAAAILPPPPAPAGAASASTAPPASWGQFMGQVVFSDVLIAPASQFPSPTAMTDALRRLKRTTVEGSEGFWRLHMVAFLQGVAQAAGASQSGSYELRATDVTDPKDRREVRRFDVEGLPNQTELPINDLVVTEVMGFERGHRYEMAVVRRADGEAGGKADVCAKGVITLM
ncbi:MAG TPA: hypothetical protein VKZ18_20680 [Polyangia bacterium]|nr:hypothetical protein [Polyangia bacterium]